jgi:hypothetical protein
MRFLGTRVMCVTQRTWAGNSCVTPYEAAALLRSTREDEMVNAEPNGARWATS